MFWLWILLIIALLLVVFSHLSFRLTFTYSEKKPSLLIRIYIFRLQFIQRKINVGKFGHSNQLNIEECVNQLRFQNMINEAKKYNDILSIVLKNIQIKTLKWHSQIGTGKAMTTGLSAGYIWTLKGLVMGAISSKNQLLNKPEIYVNPCFNLRILQSEINCIGTIRSGQAIYMFFKISKHVKTGG